MSHPPQDQKKKSTTKAPKDQILINHEKGKRRLNHA